MGSEGRLLSFEQARHVVEEHASRLRSPGRERLSLVHSAGRVLAEPVVADRNFPPFPRATRDGYAVRAADLSPLPATLAVVGEIRAGADVTIQVGSGQAAAIMTGAPVPPGADSVVMVEYASPQGDRVEIRRGIAVGEHIVAQGAEAKLGERLLSPGVRLDAAAIALASSVGKSHPLVYAKPRVAVLATGDEVVDVEMPPAPQQIRNSNSYSLAAQIQAAGGEPLLLPIAPDEPARLRELICGALDADLLLLSGGVSAGRYDFVEQVLGELKAEFFFTGAQIQPGRPIVFGRLPGSAELARGGSSEGRYFFGLPGNPVSTMVTFELFVKPVVEALAGLTPAKLVFLHAKLKSEVKTRTGLRRFLPAVLSGEFDQGEVELLPWRGSGDIAATARANCYIVITPEREWIRAGEWVPVLLR
jgi:molybdopterin molybdotransferase